MRMLPKGLLGVRNRKGQAMVETALIAPIVLILVMGVWEFGRAWNIYQTITDAAREGARVSAIANADQTMPADTVTSNIHGSLALASLDTTKATINVTGFRAGIGQPTVVSIAFPYDFSLIGYFLAWTTGQRSITLDTTVRMRNE